MRNIKVAAAQLGPIQKADSRQAVVARMLELMRQAEGCDLIVYPELALTTFFPRWYMEDQADVDAWFEREMPNAAVQPLFDRAKQHRMAMNFGYAELIMDTRGQGSGWTRGDTADPHGAAWLIKLKLSDPAQAQSLMTAAEYQAYIGAEK